MTGEVKPQDRDSGLVKRSWVRTKRRGGKTTERTLEGEEVTARFLDRHGQLQRVEGKVIRNAAGELVVESWADGVRKETAVSRDANVDAKNR